MHTLRNTTDSVTAVWFSLLGGKFILQLDHDFSPSGTFADVLDVECNVIGSASQIYADGGFAVHTQPFGGYVPLKQIVFVSESGHHIKSTLDAFTRFAHNHTITCLSNRGRDQVIAYLTANGITPAVEYITKGTARYDIFWTNGPTVDDVRQNAQR